jgi:hypothetical protein
MKRISILLAVFVALFAVVAMGKPKPGERVMRVDSVGVSVKGAVLTVKASGKVSTSGWSSPALVRSSLSTRTELVFEFVAVPPSGLATQVISPIKASTTVTGVMPSKVRVIAKTNEKAADVPKPVKSITVIGKLTPEGVECQAMREDKTNKLFTLTGNLGGFKNGDHVKVVGTIVDISICQQGTTIAVSSISRVP